MGLTLLLLLTQFASAEFTPNDANAQRTKAQAASAAADGELPPCEGLDHLDDVVGRLSPPSSCSKAKQFFDIQLQYSRKIRETCRETSRWMEDTLRQPSYCGSPSAMQANLKKLQALKIRTQLEGDEPAEMDRMLDDPQLEAWFEHDKAPPTKGEWARLECRHGLEMAMQFRLRQRQLSTKHFGYADEALNSLCTEGQQAADEYFKFLRYGEDGE